MINENGLLNIFPTAEASGSIVSFENGADGIPMESLSVAVEPIQDLHGYANPWIDAEYDKVPYNFRAVSDTTASRVGNSELGSIVGGTVAWNQLRPDSIASGTSQGIVLTFDSETGKVELSGTSTTTYRNFFSRSPLTLNHKYALIMDVLKNPNNVSFHLNAFNAVMTGTFSNPSSIAMCRLERETTNIGIEGFTANTVMDGIVLKFNIFDLTQMFGSTIADYIYSLEQATEGAGVAWFRKLFPKDYYAYDSGSLLSVNTSAHNMVGFNAWDEEWEVGNISRGTGGNSPDANKIRSKNHIHVVPNTQYFVTVAGGAKGNFVYFEYDADKNYLGTQYSVNNGYGTFTTTANACYIRFRLTDTYGSTYHNDICINLSWDGERDGEYEPYELNSYALDSSLTLRGIPKLDANNNLYYDGDTYESDGTVTRKYGIKVFDGSETWFWSTNNALAQTAVPNGIITNASTQYSAYTFNSNPTFRDSSWAARNTEKSTIGMFYGASYLFAKSDDFSSAQDVKDYFTAHPTTVIYELATPTTESATAYAATQSIDPDGTEEYVDYAESQGTRDVAIPVGHYTNYANICPISGRTGLSVYVSPTTAQADATTYAVDWTTQAGTVYGGTVDVVSGLLTVDRVYFTDKWKNGAGATSLGSYTRRTFTHAVKSKYPNYVKTPICNVANYKAAYAEDSLHFYVNSSTSSNIIVFLPNDTDGETDIQVCYELATPLTYQLTAQEVATLLGLNRVWSDAGDISLVYHTQVDATPSSIDGLFINGEGLQADGWFLKWRKLAAPKPKTDYVSVWGRDGDIDLTESETDGQVFYENRELTMDMVYMGEDWTDAYSELLDMLHGKECAVQFSNDPYWYWAGRIIASLYEHKPHSLTMSGIMFPYKLSVAKVTKSATVSGAIESNGVEVVLPSSRMRVSPKVTVVAGTGESVTLKWGTKTQTLSAGTYYVRGLKVGSDDVTIKVWGTGTVTFEYRKGML